MRRDYYSYFNRDLDSYQSKENTNAEYRCPPAMKNYSISRLGCTDSLSGELSIIKVQLVFGEERFVCMDNDSNVYSSEEFILDALFYNKELLLCIPLVNDFVAKYNEENPDNKIVLCGIMDLFISYSSKTILYK